MDCGIGGHRKILAGSFFVAKHHARSGSRLSAALELCDAPSDNARNFVVGEWVAYSSVDGFGGFSPCGCLPPEKSAAAPGAARNSVRAARMCAVSPRQEPASLNNPSA